MLSKFTIKLLFHSLVEVTFICSILFCDYCSFPTKKTQQKLTRGFSALSRVCSSLLSISHVFLSVKGRVALRSLTGKTQG